jgi:hypothetical protein
MGLGLILSWILYVMSPSNDVGLSNINGLKNEPISYDRMPGGIMIFINDQQAPHPVYLLIGLFLFGNGIALFLYNKNCVKYQKIASNQSLKGSGQ